jgi:hypothetical protein
VAAKRIYTKQVGLSISNANPCVFVCFHVLESSAAVELGIWEAILALFAAAERHPVLRKCWPKKTADQAELELQCPSRRG